MVEGIAVVVLSNGCQHVVACLIDGLQQVGSNQSESRVGGQELNHYGYASHVCCDEHYQ